MRIRSRLVLTTGYVLLTVIVAFSAALVISLDRRARSELETQSLIQANSIAQQVGEENLVPARRGVLDEIVDQSGRQVGGRVSVVDADGRLIADSQANATGQVYSGEGRPEIDAALSGHPSSVVRHSNDLGIDIMATAVPIVDEGFNAQPTLFGAVRITRPMDQVTDQLRRVIGGIGLLGLIALGAGLSLAWFLAGSLARPLDRLARAAHQLGSGDLTSRVGHVDGVTDIEEVAGSFDAMAGRLERSAQAQGEFVANASHQLRTPLTGLRLRLEVAERRAEPENRGDLKAAKHEVDRLSATVDRLLVLAREAERDEHPRADVGVAVLEVVSRWVERAAQAGASLRAREAPGEIQASIDRVDLEQIIDNLLSNAIAYAPGPIIAEARRVGEEVVLTVSDGGPGISSDDLQKVTERFARGRGASGDGSGLGLAIVRRLAERRGGSLAIRSPGPSGRGTVAEVRLPASLTAS